MKGDGMGSSVRRRDACFLVVINDDGLVEARRRRWRRRVVVINDDGLVAARRRRRVDVERDRPRRRSDRHRRCLGQSSRSVFARRGPRFLRRRRRGGRLGLLSLAGAEGRGDRRFDLRAARTRFLLDSLETTLCACGRCVRAVDHDRRVAGRIKSNGDAAAHFVFLQPDLGVAAFPAFSLRA